MDVAALEAINMKSGSLWRLRVICDVIFFFFFFWWRIVNDWIALTHFVMVNIIQPLYFISIYMLLKKFIVEDILDTNFSGLDNIVVIQTTN